MYLIISVSTQSQRRGKISLAAKTALLLFSSSIKNKVNFQRKSSDVVLKFLLQLKVSDEFYCESAIEEGLKGCSLRNGQLYQPFGNFSTSHFFENILY